MFDAAFVTIKRRYYRGIYNLTRKFIDICDYWIVINNSTSPYSFIAEGEAKAGLKIYDNSVWELIKNQPDEENQYGHSKNKRKNQ